MFLLEKIRGNFAPIPARLVNAFFIFIVKINAFLFTSSIVNINAFY